eukprot:65661-Pyramimonas_sp.AAC.1
MSRRASSRRLPSFALVLLLPVASCVGSSAHALRVGACVAHYIMRVVCRAEVLSCRSQGPWARLGGSCE